MQIEILYGPSSALARVLLQDGEAVLAEAGAMVGTSTNVEVQTQAGGLIKGLKRLFGGESFFRNTFTARGGPGEVLLSQTLPGDQVVLEVDARQGMKIQSGSFIASEVGVELDTQVGGLKTFFGGESLFVLSAHGQGKVLVGAFGGIEELKCDGDLVIDTGHLVAWDNQLDFEVGRSAAGWIASFLSGEGLVCHFRGNGRIWVQSRNPREFGQTVGKLLPSRSA